LIATETTAGWLRNQGKKGGTGGAGPEFLIGKGKTPIPGALLLEQRQQNRWRLIGNGNGLGSQLLLGL